MRSGEVTWPSKYNACTDCELRNKSELRTPRHSSSSAVQLRQLLRQLCLTCSVFKILQALLLFRIGTTANLFKRVALLISIVISLANKTFPRAGACVSVSVYNFTLDLSAVKFCHVL
jgi:hypothetical protein